MVVKVTTAALSKNRRFYEEAHLSFSGGGFLGIYHVGVALAFRDFAPYVASRKVLGTSAGALAATCLVSGFPVDKAINSIAKVAVHTRSLSLGPLHPRFNIFDIMRHDLDLFLPADAHVRSSGRLFVSVTRASTLQNELISKFDSREELIDVLMASCFIPYFLGWFPPKIKGVSYIDGGISLNVPVHDEHTITVSPFPGESQIGPRCGNLPNVAFAPETLLRLCKTIFAPSPSVLEQLVQQGYSDGVHFLQKNDMIHCQSCTAVEKYRTRASALSSRLYQINSPDPGLHRVPYAIDKECGACIGYIALSDTASVSRTILRPLESAAIEEHRDIQLRPYRHTRLARTLALIIALVILPFDIGLATIRKAAANWEPMRDVVQNGYHSFSESLKKMLMDSQKQGCRVCGAIGSGNTSASSPTLSSHKTNSQEDINPSDKAVPIPADRCADCLKKGQS